MVPKNNRLAAGFPRGGEFETQHDQHGPQHHRADEIVGARKTDGRRQKADWNQSGRVEHCLMRCCAAIGLNDREKRIPAAA